MRADTFEQLESYLRELKNFGGAPDYDFNGIFMLFESLVDNLAKNAVDADLANLIDSAPILSNAQAEFLRRLLRDHDSTGHTLSH